MTKLRTCELFTFVPAQSRKTSRLEKLSLPATVCVVVLFCAAAVIAAPAQSIFFTSLASFNGTDGAYPYAGLVQATDGNFYGTAVGGGCCALGTVFEVAPAGMVTALYSFCSQLNCTNGSYPVGGVVQASDGNFYGTTLYGGNPGCDNGYGCGTVFRVGPNGTLTTLYSFQGYPYGPDGAYPEAGLVQATDGNFYGTTYKGGASNWGTVFKITPSGTLTTLYSFCSQPHCTDGTYPYAPLVQASDGNSYGTTVWGGTSNYCQNGCGTVFKITPAGALTTLHSFDSTDGAYPYAGLVQATDGSFYGTTWGGGAHGVGTVFKITPAGTLTPLYSFDSGRNPTAGLVQATDENFYGTTLYGGYYDNGTVFQITPSGTLTTLHSFDGTDGQNPAAALVQATDGNFYGTTNGGGAYGYGTVFRLGLVRTCATCRP